MNSAWTTSSYRGAFYDALNKRRTEPREEQLEQPPVLPEGKRWVPYRPKRVNTQSKVKR